MYAVLLPSVAVVLLLTMRVYPPFRSFILGAIVVKSFATAVSSPSLALRSLRFATVSTIARVIIFSTFGRISFALASVVEIRSCSTRDRKSDLMSAPRTLVFLPNFRPFLWCLILMVLMTAQCLRVQLQSRLLPFLLLHRVQGGSLETFVQVQLLT